VVGFSAVWNLLPFFLIGTILILGLTREMNLLISGDELSASRGLDPLAIKKILFILCSLMVGATVSLCGPIGFVGMMAPHICRLLVGWNHLYLTPAVILFGGSFLTICDLLARSLTAPAEIPVGIITSLLGGPFFLWLLMRKRRL